MRFENNKFSVELFANFIPRIRKYKSNKQQTLFFKEKTTKSKKSRHFLKTQKKSGCQCTKHVVATVNLDCKITFKRTKITSTTTRYIQ